MSDLQEDDYVDGYSDGFAGYKKDDRYFWLKSAIGDAYRAGYNRGEAERMKKEGEVK